MPSRSVRLLKHGNVHVVTLEPPSGVISSSDLEEISGQLRSLGLGEESQECLLNFERVHSLDAGFVDVLVQLCSDICAQKGQLALVGVSEALDAVFKEKGVFSLFAVYQSESEAIQALGKTVAGRIEAGDRASWSHQAHDEVFVVFVHTRRLKERVTVTDLADGVELFVEERHARFVLMDFSEVEFMTSSMIGRLLRLRKRLVANGGRLGLVGMSDSIRQVFATTRLDRFFEVYPSLEKALKRFRPQ
jgi:anti-sigma B factor antagonist